MHRKRGTKSLSNKLLGFLFRRGCSPNGTSGAGTAPSYSIPRSLYILNIVLVFGTFFALMLLIQMMSMETTEGYSSFFSDGEDEEAETRWGGILGRFRFTGGKTNEEKEIVLPHQIARELERILTEARYNADSFSPPSGDSLDLVLSSSSNETVANLTQFYTAKDFWQPVNGSKDKFYVFSGYFDDRNSKVRYIRVIAATKTRSPEKVVCKLWYTHAFAPIVVNAVNKIIRENWNLKYSAYFVLCLLGHHPVPDAVSVLVKTNSTLAPSNRLLVHNHPKLKKRQKYNATQKGFAVCVKPMHYDYNKLINLIEFIELNRLLGVNHFVLYNHTIGEQVNCLLRDYIEKGLLTILPWDLDMVSQKEIRTEGLFAALNDCLYRTMYSFRYVLMIDFDEYIIPHLQPNLHQLLAAINKLNNNANWGGAYSFQNAFFYIQWPNDANFTSQQISPHPLLTLMKTRRKSKLHIHKQRSKCIVIPESVVEMGNHFVWEFVPGKAMINVAPKFALLHHYRICEFGGNDCVKTPSTIDRRVYAWEKPLVANVEGQVARFNGRCLRNASRPAASVHSPGDNS